MQFFQTFPLHESPAAEALAGDAEQSPRRINGSYDSISAVKDMSFSDHASIARDFLFSENERTPENAPPSVSVNLSHFTRQETGQLNVTWLGHSSLMIHIDGFRILTDPVFEKSVSIVGPSRYNGDIPLDIRKIPPVDAVIISHDHYDHLNKYSVRHLKDKAKAFIVPTGVGPLLTQWGIPEDKIMELDWWLEHSFNENLMIAATPSQHFSGRGICDRNKTLWASWVIRTRNHRVFFSGDSGYFSGFKKIGDKYGPFDMTFIECGAYDKSWAGVHMFPEQTVQAHLDLKGKILHPIHWGTFNLALHPWYEPMDRLTAAADARHVDISTPAVGDTTIFGKYQPTAKWWKPAESSRKD